MTKTVGKVLFTEEEISNKAKEMGRIISADYEGEELVVIGTLKGSVMWMCELIKYIDVDMTIDFIKASSYGSSTTSSGIVKFKMDTELNLYNKNILLVEDIVDTGITLTHVIEKLKERGPKSIKVCTMLNKMARRSTPFKADYIGYEVEDLFIVGYGLDYDEKYRDLPYISYLDGDM